MKNLFAVCLGFILVVGLGGVNVAVSEELETSVITTTNEEKENVQPETEETDKPDTKPETEKPVEEEPVVDSEENIEQENETAPENTEENDSSPTNQEEKDEDIVDITDKEKQNDSTIDQEDRVTPPSPAAPPVEESAPVVVAEEVEEFFISDYGEVLSKWKHEFDVLYIPVLYDLLRYYAENDKEVIELDHLSKSQLSELARFLDEEPQVTGATYSSMREAVEEYLDAVETE
ncbi:hypothetical protein [Sutcliffiella horikoshii]|uniref:hypothetical protein n=1 Tax=Sutcliffiella horikoshii TaxID=79883 RepID=UPI001CFD34E9|nr:hypothetical protein [Sutcliffiella horikoshii]